MLLLWTSEALVLFMASCQFLKCSSVKMFQFAVDQVVGIKSIFKLPDCHLCITSLRHLCQAFTQAKLLLKGN
jgi:hypothetical protein